MDQKSSMRTRSFLGILAVGLSFIFFSCQSVNDALAPVPVAFGKINQIVVVADEGDWNSDLKDSLQYHFQSPYPILPQPEPYFDLKYFSPQQLRADPLRKEMKSYLILADLSDSESETTQLIKNDLRPDLLDKANSENGYGSAIGKDKWAQGQIVIYLFANSADNLREAVRESFPALAKKLNESDAKQKEGAIYGGGENGTLNDLIRDSLNINIRIPKGYFVAIQNGDFAWLRNETKRVSNNIMLLRIPYESKDQFSKTYVKNLRDSIGYAYVASSAPDAYMKINDIDLPMLTNTVNIKNQFAYESRGIWEMEGDFLGGPFVSYLISTPDSKDLIFADGFIHAPGQEKRDHLQHLEYIINTISFN